jgi:hypothetical protein
LVKDSERRDTIVEGHLASLEVVALKAVVVTAATYGSASQASVLVKAHRLASGNM